MSDSASARIDQGASPQARLLLRLDVDPTRAGEKYEYLRRRLVKFFEWNNCAGPEDLADDVLDRVGSKPESEAIQDVAHYALGVARYVRLEAHKRMQREIHIEGLDSLAENHVRSQAIIEKLDQEQRLAGLRDCLAELMPGDRELIVQYYSSEEKTQKRHRRQVAERAGLTQGALRVRTNRIREKLEQCMRSRLNSRG